eukprot:SAG31_NODE_1023_length_10298_cov_3.003530_7_plen_226_part_00
MPLRQNLRSFSHCRDATSSGASGDSNMILSALLGRKFGGRALIPIVDAPAVAVATNAGVGKEVTLTLGGTLDPERFTPLRIDHATVISLHEGSFVYENGTSGYAGDVAVLRCNVGEDDSSDAVGIRGSIDILVASQSAYFVGQACFKSFGLNPRDYDVVVVKSPNGFRPHYASIAQSIVPVDVPGSTSANLLSLPFRHVQRPIYPLDSDARPLALMELSSVYAKL